MLYHYYDLIFIIPIILYYCMYKYYTCPAADLDFET